MAEPREVPAAQLPGVEDSQADLVDALCRSDDHGQAAFTSALASADVACCRLACRALRAVVDLHTTHLRLTLGTWLPKPPAADLVPGDAEVAVQGQKPLQRLCRLAERWPRCKRLDLHLEFRGIGGIPHWEFDALWQQALLPAAGGPLRSVTCLRLTAVVYTRGPVSYRRSGFDKPDEDGYTDTGDSAPLSGTGASALGALFPSLEELELGRGVGILHPLPPLSQLLDLGRGIGLYPEGRPAVFGALTGLRRLSMAAHLYDDEGVKALTRLTSLALLKLTLEDEDLALAAERKAPFFQFWGGVVGAAGPMPPMPPLVGPMGPDGAPPPPPPAPLFKGLAALPQLRALELEGSRLAPGCPTPKQLLELLPGVTRLTLRHFPMQVPRLAAASGAGEGPAWAYDNPGVPRSRAHTQAPHVQLDTETGSLRLCGRVGGVVELAELVRAFDDALGGQLRTVVVEELGLGGPLYLMLLDGPTLTEDGGPESHVHVHLGDVGALSPPDSAAITYLGALFGSGGGGGEGSRGGPRARLRVLSAGAGFNAASLLLRLFFQVRCPPELLLVHGHGRDGDLGLVPMLQSLGELPPEALPPQLRVSGYLRSGLSGPLAAWPPLQALVIMARLEERPPQDSRRSRGGPRGRQGLHYDLSEPHVDSAAECAALLRQAAAKLAPGGWCAVQCKPRHGAAAVKLVREAVEAEAGAGVQAELSTPRCVELLVDGSGAFWLCGANDEAALCTAFAEVLALVEGIRAEAD